MLDTNFNLGTFLAKNRGAGDGLFLANIALALINKVWSLNEMKSRQIFDLGLLDM